MVQPRQSKIRRRTVWTVSNHTVNASAYLLPSTKNSKRHIKPCRGAQDGDITLVTSWERTLLYSHPYGVPRMIHTPQYLRLCWAEEGRGFRPWTEDRLLRRGFNDAFGVRTQPTARWRRTLPESVLITPQAQLQLHFLPRTVCTLLQQHQQQDRRCRHPASTYRRFEDWARFSQTSFSKGSSRKVNFAS